MVQLSVEEAFIKFGPELLRHASMLVGPAHAEDVVSEAIIGALRSPKFSAVENQLGYLHRSVANGSNMFHRARLRATRREWAAGQPSDLAHYDHLSRPEVIAAIGRLSHRQRSVVFLTYWGDMRPAEVASTLGIAEGSVKKYLVRARGVLRGVLDD